MLFDSHSEPVWTPLRDQHVALTNASYGESWARSTKNRARRHLWQDEVICITSRA